MRWPFLVPILATLLQMTAARAAVPLSKASTGHVTVPAMVDGQGPFDFVFDTGADESAVYAWFAKSLDLPKTKQRKVSGATGDAQMAGARLASLTVDGHTIRHVDADILPDRLDGVRFAGVVGVDLMLHRLAVLDFGCGTATLLPVPKTPGAEVGSGCDSDQGRLDPRRQAADTAGDGERRPGRGGAG
ncbi:MAG: retropepsin-like aspartic protease [Aliidongia sp.]